MISSQARQRETDNAFLFACHAAIVDWADQELARLTRQVIHAFSRRAAVDAFCETHTFQSEWDEYCHVIQTGLHRPDWFAQGGLMCRAVIERQTREAQNLLTVAALDDLSQGEETEDVFISVDMICQMLVARLNTIAADRNLRRYQRFPGD